MRLRKSLANPRITSLCNHGTPAWYGIAVSSLMSIYTPPTSRTAFLTTRERPWISDVSYDIDRSACLLINGTLLSNRLDEMYAPFGMSDTDIW
jgi:hypothetical protein